MQRICLRPPCSTISFLNFTPSSVSLETRDSKSSTVKTNLNHPPGLGLAPSGIGLDADAFGPATHSFKSPWTRIAIAGPYCCSSLKPSCET